MKKLKIIIIASITAFIVLTVTTAYAGFGYRYSKMRVTIKNLTRGQIFSPPIVISHKDGFTLFETGDAASSELSLLAEDGDASMMMTLADESPLVLDSVIFDSAVLPGMSVSIDISSNFRYNLISLAGMLVTTNDAFVAVQGVGIPWGKNQITVNAVAYDAGSEANSENCAFIPGPPCGNGGMRDTDEAEGFVYVHGGIHGIGELMPYRDDWNNPVAEITVEYLY